MCLIFYSGQFTPFLNLSFLTSRIKISLLGIKIKCEDILYNSVNFEYLVLVLHLEGGGSVRL